MAYRNCVLDGNLDCAEFITHADGVPMDPNEKTITVSKRADDSGGGCDWIVGYAFVTDAAAFDGCTWNIAGNFTANAQTLNAEADWYLNVTGTAVASGVGEVEYSDALAGGGTEITASAGPWTDGNNNDNWDFGAVGGFAGRSYIIGGGIA